MKVELDMQRVHELSVDLMTSLETDEVTVGDGIAAMALSIGRMLSPKVPMEVNEEVKFVQGLLEWCGAYFTEGGVN